MKAEKKYDKSLVVASLHQMKKDSKGKYNESDKDLIRKAAVIEKGYADEVNEASDKTGKVWTIDEEATAEMIEKLPK